MFKEKDLPKEVWISEGKAVKLCDELEKAYINCLNEYGAFEMAKNHDGKGSPTGGESDEVAIEHFAYRFVNSGTRVTHLTLDPDKKFSKIQQDIFATFSKGNISILDLACGTGGHILALLTTIIELRKNSLLPNLPLNIFILAADISLKALEIYEALLNDIKPYVEDLCITIYFETISWDACSPSDANKLMNSLFSFTNGTEINEYYVITSAFSGFAGNEENFLKVKKSLEFITIRLSDKHSTFLWIEPNTKQGNKFLKKLSMVFDSLIDLFTKWIGLESELVNQYSWFEPLKKVVIPTGQLSVKLYKRDNNEEL